MHRFRTPFVEGEMNVYLTLDLLVCLFFTICVWLTDICVSSGICIDRLCVSSQNLLALVAEILNSQNSWFFCINQSTCMIFVHPWMLSYKSKKNNEWKIWMFSNQIDKTWTYSEYFLPKFHVYLVLPDSSKWNKNLISIFEVTEKFFFTVSMGLKAQDDMEAANRDCREWKLLAINSNDRHTPGDLPCLQYASYLNVPADVAVAHLPAR